jgi:hypothetical protein
MAFGFYRLPIAKSSSLPLKASLTAAHKPAHDVRDECCIVATVARACGGRKVSTTFWGGSDEKNRHQTFSHDRCMIAILNGHIDIFGAMRPFENSLCNLQFFLGHILLKALYTRQTYSLRRGIIFH